MLAANFQALTRRGGVLQGPRLIAAILVVTLFIFYLSSTTHSGIDYSKRPVGSTAYGDHGGKDVVQEMTQDHNKEKESETLSNKFFDYLGHHKTPPKPSKASASAASTPTSSPAFDSNSIGDPVCGLLAKGTQNLLVVVKTPASELYNQLPSRFLTNLRCAPTLLFSYVGHKIGSYVVHDALSNVTEKTREKHRDFDLYMRLQTASHAFQDFSTISEDNDHNLDRFAIIPTLVASYNMHPEKKWFALIEGNTYLSLPNILAWVGQLDPEVPFYSGAQTMLGSVELGSSAAGLIFSRGAVRKLAKLYESRKSAWEDLAADRCCGDQILAEALREANVTLHRSWPNTQGESPLSIDWSNRHWCRSAVTWHRMTPPLMDMLWQFERNWTLHHAKENEPKPESIEVATTTRGWFKRAESTPVSHSSISEDVPATSKVLDFTASIGIPPILYKDYFEGFIIPLVQSSQNRTDWDNLSQALVYTDSTRGGSYAHSSPDTCRAACDIRAKCVQYVHEPNKCRLGTAVRIGEPVAADKRMKSGWLPHRVKKFAHGLGTCTNGEAFFMPSEKAPEPEKEPEPMKEEYLGETFGEEPKQEPKKHPQSEQMSPSREEKTSEGESEPKEDQPQDENPEER